MSAASVDEVGATSKEMTAPETIAREVETVVAPYVVQSQDHGRELKRGAWANALAMLASNFRGIFTFLVARLLSPAALGAFSVSWAATELLATLGTFGLDDTITTFVAREQARGDRARARALARLAILLALLQCTLITAIAIAIVSFFGKQFELDPQMATALMIAFCALPGIALYRVSNSVSRGMKVMRHNIFSRGLTETVATTLAFLLALEFGSRIFAPQFGALIGTSASGVIAFLLARSLFRPAPPRPTGFSDAAASAQLLAFSAQVTAYDVLNALIVRIDVIMLGCFVGRAPEVTLSTVGIYGAVVEVAGGLRKVNQIYSPIVAPIIAGMTVHGEQERASAAFSRVSQWMLWVLVPIIAVMILAGPLILSIYGPAFRQGSMWLTIVALACGMNAFVGLAETVIMVQKPHLNLWNSVIGGATAIVGNIFLIGNFGTTGAAFGILLPYVVLGLLRYRTLKVAFQWKDPWSNIHPPLLAALFAAVPALICRATINRTAGQVAASLVFLAIYFVVWRAHRTRNTLPDNLA